MNIVAKKKFLPLDSGFETSQPLSLAKNISLEL